MTRVFVTLITVTTVSLFLCPNYGTAQSTGANILGTVTDGSGAVVAGATVTASNLDTNFSRSAETGATGQFLLQFLPVGTYRLDVQAEGFKTFTQRGVVLELGRNARIDPRLELGSVTEVIEVTSDAPLVETTNAALGQTVNNRDILNLPLVNRNVYDLLSLTAGVDQTSDEFTFGQPGQLTTINGSANGGMGGVNYTLDGGGNVQGLRNTGNPAPNPDAVQEFRVTTNSFNAEHGRFAGGVVQVITKSGTNQIHGSLFEFLRNDKLNAREWSASDKAPLRRNQFGGALGGPLIRDKLFAFGSYAGLRQRESTFFNDAIVPTQAQRTGDFSASGTTLIDPETEAPFPNNIIPASRLDPTAQRIINDWIPLANLPGQFFEIQQAVPTDSDELTAKLDYYLTQNHQLSGTYFFTDGKVIEALRGNLPWNRRQFLWRQQNFHVSDTWTKSPTTINQFNATYVRHFGGRLNTPQIALGDLGSDFQIQGPKALPLIEVDDYFELDTPIAGPTAGSNYYQLRDTVTWLRGKHSLKFGAEVSLEKIIHDTTLDNYGEFDFRDDNTGDAFGDFLLGIPRDMVQDAPITKTDDAWYTAFFVQDDWRLHPRFMLNLGLRYEIQFPPVDPQDRKNIFIPGRQSQVVPSAPLGMLFPGDPGITRGIIPKDLNNFGPRIGLAWDPTGDGKTSVRAGFGLFYASIGGNNANGSADRVPFTVRQTFRNVDSLTHPYRNFPNGVSPFPYVYDPADPIFLFPVRMKSRDLDFRWPYTYQMNFSIQRELVRDFSVTAAYVSTLSHKIPTTLDGNYPIFTPDATTGNVDDRRPFQGYADIEVYKSISNSAYHGLQITLDKRMSRNFSFKGFYTFGKAIDDVDVQDDSTGMPVNSTNLRNDRGRSNSDRRHNFLLSAIWDINYFQDANPVVRALLNGWTLSTITSLRSGAPFSVITDDDANLDGEDSDRADLIGNPHLDSGRPRSELVQMFFNTAAFIENQRGRDGTAGRNILDGPGLKNVSLAIFRNFRIGERWNLQFRTEMTNGLNFVNLDDPENEVTDRRFGTIRGARSMREIQLGLRLTF